VRLRPSAADLPGQAAGNSQLRLAAARLYVITPDAPADRVVDIAVAAQRGGADVIQLRHKTLARGELLTLARTLRGLISQALFIVNDHADIAMLSGADGVHLGPDDLSPKSARKVAGDRLLIGVSASAAGAVPPEADYVGCGPAFATPLKPHKGVVGPAGVAALAARIGVPVFAIGGIDETNVGQLTALGVHRVCVIRAVGDAADPEQATRRLRAMLDSA
jgi:thiamine-phosphate pyrophosphorylase